MSPRGDRILAVDVGGTKIMAALVDSRFKVLARYKKKTKAYKGPREVLRRIVRCVDGLFTEHRLDRRSVGALGMAVAGSVDFRTGRVLFSPNLGFHNAPLRRLMSQTYKCPIFIENDVKAGTLAEARLGAARGASSVLGAFLGTGIGGGILIDGKIYRGEGFTAGEVGHMIVEPGGPRCGCGRRGCWEAVAGRLALARDIKKAVKDGRKSVLKKLALGRPDEMGSNDIREALENHDAVARDAVARAGRASGIALASLVNVLNPRVVVVGGGQVEAFGRFLLPEIKRAFESHAIPAAARLAKIVPARLKDDAVLLGAAVTARENLP